MADPLQNDRLGGDRVQPERPGMADTTSDTAVHQWLDALGDAVPDSVKSDFAKVGDDATMLLNWFIDHERGDPAIDTAMPQNIKDAESRLLANDAVSKRIIVADGPDKGKITRDTLKNLVNDVDSAAKSAKTSWNAFKGANKSADAATFQMALDANLLQANVLLLDAAAPDSKIDGNFAVADLLAVSSGDSHVPEALKNAAALYSQPGMFAMLDTGGMDVTSSHEDGLADQNNIGKYVSLELSSVKPDQLGAILNEAADHNAVAGIDISQLDHDVFDHPKKYTGAQKAAVMQHLADAKSRLEAGLSATDFYSPSWAAEGFNENPNQIIGDLRGRISQLSSDEDVQKFIADTHGAALRNIVSADPGLKERLKTIYKNDVQNGRLLKDALSAKDSNGKTVSPEDGLASYMQTATALYTVFKEDMKLPDVIDLQSMVNNSGQIDVLQKAFTDNILSGKTLREDIENGVEIGTAIDRFTRDAAHFGAVLPGDVMTAHIEDLRRTVSDTITDSLVDTSTTEELTAALSDANGNLDEPKIAQIIAQAEAQGADILTASDGTKIQPNQLIGAINSVFTAIRKGVKLKDALSKLDSSRPPLDGQKPLTQLYNRGVIHGVGALMLGAVIAVRQADLAPQGRQKLTIGELTASMQLMGAALEGGSKYMKDTGRGPLSPRAIKLMEANGKMIGGAGSAIAGVFSLIAGAQAAKNGDKAGAGVNFTFGITNFFAGASAAIEGGVNFLEAGGARIFGVQLGESAMNLLATLSPRLAVLSSGLGYFAAAAFVPTLFGYGIYLLVDGRKRVVNFQEASIPELKQFGITGGKSPAPYAPAEQYPFAPS